MQLAYSFWPAAINGRPEPHLSPKSICLAKRQSLQFIMSICMRLFRTVRDFKNFDLLAYNVDLMNLNLLHVVDSYMGIDDAWATWSSKVKSVMDKRAPIRCHRVKNR